MLWILWILNNGMTFISSSFLDICVWSAILICYGPRSNDYYPDLYCGCIEATETACFEQNIIELWGDQVKHYHFDFIFKSIIFIFLYGEIR